MRCPGCDSSLLTVDYEGVTIESCGTCGGEWLDAEELGHIVRIREEHFSEEERQAIDSAARIPGVPVEEIERDIMCPKCGVNTGPINYGADTGIIIDRCPQCSGIWVDSGELEKIQMLVENWKDNLPEDLRRYGPRLDEVAREVTSANQVVVSRLPLVGSLVNAVVNGMLDLK